ARPIDVDRELVGQAIVINPRLDKETFWQRRQSKPIMRSPLHTARRSGTSGLRHEALRRGIRCAPIERKNVVAVVELGFPRTQDDNSFPIVAKVRGKSSEHKQKEARIEAALREEDIF